MDCELPVLRKCCFFFPLRPGLMACGYFKFLVAAVIEIWYAHMLVKTHVAGGLIGAVISIIIIDTAATVVFIVGCHLKNLLCLTWFYSFSIYLLIIKAIGLFFLALFHPIPWQALPNIFIHIYLQLIIRSVFIKLNNVSQPTCEFENKLSDPNCTIMVVNPEVPEIEKGLEAVQVQSIRSIDTETNDYKEREVTNGIKVTTPTENC